MKRKNKLPIVREYDKEYCAVDDRKCIGICHDKYSQHCCCVIKPYGEREWKTE